MAPMLKKKALKGGIITGYLTDLYYTDTGQPNKESITAAAYTVDEFLQAAKATNFNDSDKVTDFAARFQSKLRNPAENNADTKEALHSLALTTALREYEPFLRLSSHQQTAIIRHVYISQFKKKSSFTKPIIEKAKELRANSEDDINVFTTKTLTKGQTPLHFAVAQYPGRGDDGISDIDAPDQATTCPNTLVTLVEENPQVASLKIEAEGVQNSSSMVNEINAMDGALLEQDSNGNTPYQAIVSELETKLEAVMASRNERRQDYPEEFDVELRSALTISDIRAKTITRYCIRNMIREDALKALYKVGNERVIEFDLSHLLSSTINTDFLRGLAKVLRFESVLSYVALPRLSIQDDKDLQQYLDMEIDNENNEKEIAEIVGSKGKGLTNLYPIFRWLRLLDVRSIVKVTVIDDVEPSHSDAAIEACLEGFNIEKWNWKKFDICSNVILKAAPNVQDVILYSSSNNAVLLGWASSMGLCKLKKGLESKTRLNMYLEEFKNTLKSYDHLKDVPIEYTLDDPNNSLASVFVEKEITPENNPWLQGMKGFAKFLQNAKPRADPINIAIIDDGINTNLDTFEGKIHSGDSFYDPSLDSFHGRRGVYYVPSGRHGTLMAQLICNICPVVKLFVAQLQATPGRDQQRSFTTQSATKAIQWATARDVDIISMSWSIDENASGGDDLRNAIAAASNAGILMFCSCTDRGAAYKGETLPGNSGLPFRIGAARASGEKLPWVAGPQSEYLLPGENIKPEEPDAWSHHRSGPFGSSIATALASGLAGALLYCDRLLDCEEKYKTINKTEVDYLRDKKNMKKVFDNMSTGVQGAKFVEVRNNITAFLPDAKDMLWNQTKDNQQSATARVSLQTFMDAMKGKSHMQGGDKWY
ncbi:hypothetical protein EKO27_g6306 [Xylaria grammica]|uniref:Peptidase S8/S53 domain-containing protein n=1 Tax=Xylaria grammica TaxID=363999 RepID=A0A439D2Y2_9PEZI|nr:hypothetical protein EKO27_g6306 [Xylaria grammica]